MRDLRERRGIAPLNPAADRPETVSVDHAAKRLKICVGSVDKLIRQGTLPATQSLRSAPWQIPVAALTFDNVRMGVQEIVDRRPRKSQVLQDDRMIRRNRGKSVGDAVRRIAFAL